MTDSKEAVEDYLHFPFIRLWLTDIIVINRWTQPAQDIINWITVEGMTIKEWLGQWNLLMQRHHQLHSNCRVKKRDRLHTVKDTVSQTYG